MEAVLGVAFVALVLFAVVVMQSRRGSFRAAARSPDRTSAWNLLADRMGAKVGNQDGRRIMTFQWKEFTAEFRETRKGHRLTISCEGVFEREIRIWHRDVESKHRELLSSLTDNVRLRRVVLPDWQDSFRIMGESQSDARDFMNHRARVLLWGTGVDYLVVSPRGFRMDWHWKGRIPKKEMIVGSLHLATEAERVFGRSESGIHVVEEEEGASGQCQICGTDLGGVLSRCRSCGTPHHQDCWEYVGACSTYGCGGREADSSWNG